MEPVTAFSEGLYNRQTFRAEQQGMDRELIGTRLAHYEITAKLGQGGMGAVYRAHDSQLGREVAIKTLPGVVAEDPSRLERFRREARAIAALNHPNIVTLYSVEEADGIHFLTMEYVEGETLDRIIASGGLDLARFLEIAMALVGAIDAAHAKGITHRDLKPQNVMVTAEGTLKVLDFGLAKIQQERDFASTHLPTEGLTGEGVVLGTVAYMSPEQTEGKAVDHRTDLFSLGVILYEMATGNRPFRGDSAAAVMGSILRDQPPPIDESRTDWPRQVDRIVQACLEKEPPDRFQSARDVYNGLRQLRQEIDTSPAITDTAPGRPEPPRAASKRLVLAAAVLAVSILALLGWWLLRPKTTSESSASDTLVAADDEKRTMIAVLPLRNLGPSEDEFFAAGITDEILSRLATVKGLGVVSTGAESPYRDLVRASVIGKDLGVDYILTGSVRWASAAEGTSRVRISPKLIRVDDETHLWAEVYDRSIDDIFEIQSEIALHVADELGAALLEPERDALSRRPTDNPEAYQAYLRGMVAADSVGCTVIRDRIDYLHRATELDPDFVEAWAYTSRAHSAAFAHCREHAEEDRLEAWRTLERTRELAPDSWLALEAEGKYLTQVERNYDAALKPLQRAAELIERWEIYFSLGRIYRRMGDWERALQVSQRALELFPDNVELIMRVGAIHHWMRNYDQALENYDRAVELGPEWNNTYLRKAWVHWQWRGDLASARVALETLPPDEPSPNIQWGWFWQRFYEGDFEGAIAGLEAAPEDRLLTSAIFSEPKELLRAQAYEQMGDEDNAQREYELARDKLEAMTETAPDAQDLLQALATAYAGLERPQDAKRVLSRLQARLPFEREPYYGASVLQVAALVHTRLGDYDRALEELDLILAVPAVVSIPWLEIDQRWEPLRAHPGWESLQKRYADH